MSSRISAATLSRISLLHFFLTAHLLHPPFYLASSYSRSLRWPGLWLWPWPLLPLHAISQGVNSKFLRKNCDGSVHLILGIILPTTAGRPRWESLFLLRESLCCHGSSSRLQCGLRLGSFHLVAVVSRVMTLPCGPEWLTTIPTPRKQDGGNMWPWIPHTTSILMGRIYPQD